MYYDYREPVKTIPSHRMLAIRRGETENVLYFLIELEPQRAARSSAPAYPTSSPAIGLRNSSWPSKTPGSACSILPSRAKFAWNSSSAPMPTPSRFFARISRTCCSRRPPGHLAVLGIDPGIRTGCKIAVVDDTGKFLAHDVIYPSHPKNAAAGAGDTLATLIAKHNVRAIAIGNGTASRETDAFVRDFLREGKLDISSP